MMRIACVTMMAAASLPGYVWAQSNIHPDHKNAWTENVGWTNWRDANGTADGIAVGPTFLSGYVWCENVGWIHAGDGNGPYGNNNDTDFGVNIDANDDLNGYAWAENVGWLNFDTGSVAPNQARYDRATGRFRGYVWGENIGWVNLDDATHYVATECLLVDPPEAEDPVVPKNRYISFVPQNAGVVTALRVTLVDLPSPFQGDEGCQLWVAAPSTITEASGSNGSTPPPTFTGAELQATVHCRDWGTVGLLDVYDDEIVPDALYEVQAVDCDCNLDNEANYSVALAIETSIWGDIVGHCAVTPCTPPDGDVDFNDITAVLDKFKNLPGAPRKARADIAPDFPNRKVDFTDISYITDAFRGLPYPFDGPDECP